MDTKPEITDEDLLRAKDFESVLRRLKKHKNKTRTRFAIALFLGAISIIITSRYFFFQTKQKNSSDGNKIETLAHGKETDTFKVKKIQPEQTSKPGQRIKATSSSSHSERNVKIPIETPISSSTPYIPAAPVAGFPALYAYFDKELVYPQTAIKDSIMGVVSINLLITAEGKTTQLNVIQSLSPACDNEALRVVQNMPAWKPAMLDGKPVDSKLTIPVTFSFKRVRK